MPFLEATAPTTANIAMHKALLLLPSINERLPAAQITQAAVRSEQLRCSLGPPKQLQDEQ